MKDVPVDVCNKHSTVNVHTGECNCLHVYISHSVTGNDTVTLIIQGCVPIAISLNGSRSESIATFITVKSVAMTNNNYY